MSRVRRKSKTGDHAAAPGRSSDTPGTRGRSVVLLVILIFIVAGITAAVHWPVLSAGAVSLDDDLYFFSSPVLQDPGWASVGLVFREVLDPSTVEGYYEPLTLTSLMIDVGLGGRSDYLAPFHTTNLALHVFNTALIVLLLYLLCGRPWAAALAGLLFGVHPLTVEPVAWVWERKTLLATFLALWCLILYVRYARRPGWISYGAVWLTFALALMAKPTVTPLPMLLLLLDYWPLRRLSRRAVLEKVPLLLVAAISAVITVVSTSRTAAVALPGEYSLGQIPLRTCYLLAFYLGKIVWPVHLSSVYAIPPMSLSQPLIAGAVLLVGALIALLGVSLRRTRALFTGGVFFFLAILPTLGVIRYSWVSASDKYVYFPCIGLLLLLAYLLGRLWRDSGLPGTGLARRRAGIVAVVVLFAAGETVVTRQYLLVWRDTETLCRYMLKLTPQSPVLNVHLGAALARQQRRGEAIACFEEAIRIDPRFADAHYNLGVEMVRQGRPSEAVPRLRTAIEIKRVFPEARNNLGIALAQQGQIDAAIEQFNEVIRLRPRFAEGHSNLALALVKRGRLDEAVAHYREAIRLSPRHALPHKNMAIALLRLGRGDEAIAEYRAALRINPADADGHCDLGDLYVGVGRPAEAAREYRESLRINPGHARARQRLDAVSTGGSGSTRF